MLWTIVWMMMLHSLGVGRVLMHPQCDDRKCWMMTCMKKKMSTHTLGEEEKCGWKDKNVSQRGKYEKGLIKKQRETQTQHKRTLLT